LHEDDLAKYRVDRKAFSTRPPGQGLLWNYPIAMGTCIEWSHRSMCWTGSLASP